MKTETQQQFDELLKVLQGRVAPEDGTPLSGYVKALMSACAMAAAECEGSQGESFKKLAEYFSNVYSNLIMFEITLTLTGVLTKVGKA